MGKKKFLKKSTLYVLKFEGEDDELDGLEVTIRSLSIREFLALTRLSKSPDEAGDAMMERFASALVEWNLADEDGRDVPADLDGVQVQEPKFILRLISAWMEQMAGVDAPLAQSSSDGQPSLEALMAMEMS
jgi:hypothetical protein